MSSAAIKQTGPPASSGFSSFGEQLLAIRTYCETRRPIDPRLLEVSRRAAAAGSSEQVASDGGFTVAPEFRRQIIERMYQTGAIFSRCMSIPTLKPSVIFPQFDESSRADGSRMGGVQVFAENEAEPLVAARPKFQLSEITANKLTGLMACTDELAMDTDAFNTWASLAFSQELKFRIEDLVVNGTGAGEFLGILNSAALITVAKQSAQASGSVVAQNIADMSARLWSASRPNAVWLFSQPLRSQLTQLTLSVGTAGGAARLWTSEAGVDYLDGVRAMESEYCAAPGSVGDVILCDLSRYLLVIRELLRGEVSLQVRWLTDESTFRFIARLGGQPIDSRPVVPRNGTATTSPFVVLAAR